MCKPCTVLRNTEYWRTPNGRISQIFAIQTVCSRQRKQEAPAYSRKELTTWAYQHGLDALWTSWRDSGYLKELTPSVDRLDPNYGYTLQNIRLVTWTENNEKAYEDRKSCKHITKQNRLVNQLDLAGNVIKTFGSISAASRETGVARVPINYVCLGKKSCYTAGGFKWAYA